MDKTVVYDGYLKVEKVNGKERVHPKNAVAAVVYNPTTNRYLLVEQWRVGVESRIHELVAGKLDKDGESAAEAITREIEEEMGYKVSTLRPLVTFYVSPGYCTEFIILFYAEVAEKISDGGGVDGEDIKIVEYTYQELMDTDFVDAKTIIGISMI